MFTSWKHVLVFLTGVPRWKHVRTGVPRWEHVLVAGSKAVCSVVLIERCYSLQYPAHWGHVYINVLVTEYNVKWTLQHRLL